MATRARLLVSLASLVVVGLALLSNPSTKPALAENGPDCPMEGECTFAKPNVLFAVEYSAAMNLPFDAQQTRWEHVVNTLSFALQDGGFISQNFHVALLRFAHDPDPDQPGTLLPGTDLVDGLALDHAWIDPDTLDYIECPGPQLVATLDALPAPIAGTGTWTRGALLQAATLVEQTRVAKGEAPKDRGYVVFVFTQGIWTNAEGDTPLAPPQDDPVAMASLLYDTLGVKVYVSEFGSDPAGEAAANALAAAGGTESALSGMGEGEALSDYVQDIIDQLEVPDCTADRPRILIVLDASSSMLDLNGAAAPAGAGAWDRARSIITDYPGIFEFLAPEHVADLSLTGLLVSGGPVPEEQRVLVPYGPCRVDEMNWALDPETSCQAPGCRDPWGGPPITWTPATTLAVGWCENPDDPPTDVHSHMPRCDGPGPACAGSGSFLHLGLQLAATYQAQTHAAGLEPDAPLPTKDSTRYINVLITDGYFGDSTDAQVQTALEAMFANQITTRVIGVGELLGTPEFEAQLTAMAAWGSGGSHGPSHADDLAEVQAALLDLVLASQAQANPCCAYYDCNAIVECWDEDDGGFDTTDTTETTRDSSESSGESESESAESETGESGTTETETSESSGSGTTTGSADEIGDDSTHADSTGGGLDLPDRGCDCTSDAPASGPASLVLLALLGLRRRRRRLAQ